MATNWQPPFGLPFAMSGPPQTPQHQSHSQNQTPNGQYQAQPGSWAPQTDEQTSPWGIPGLNTQSYGQNNQTPYSPAAWPPAIPTPQMWQQAMQMQFPGMLPNGALPPPPPPIPYPGPFPQPPAQTITHPPPPGLSPAAQTFRPSQPAAPATDNHQQHMDVMDIDKEDGEVSETDGLSRSPAGKASGYKIPPPPRSAPQTTPRGDGPIWASHRERYTPNQPAAAQKPAEPSNPIPQQREEAKKFIKLLHSHNIGYHTLAAEDLDRAQLRDLYRGLNLPSEPEPLPPFKPTAEVPPPVISAAPSSAALANTAPIQNEANLTAVKTNVSTVPPARSAPSPVDRKDYIARLQAAKKGKQGSAAKTASPQQTPPAASTATPVAQQSSLEEQKARQTRLIQERIQALKNNTSSPTPSKLVNNNNAPLANPPPSNGLPSTPSAPLVQPPGPPMKAQQAPQATPIAPFSGIPGLFMNSPSAVQNAPTTPSAKKRPLASDFMEAPATKRAHPEPMVVDDSINRGNDGATAEPPSTSLPVTDWTSKSIPPTVSASTPSRPISANPVHSAVSTPRVQTPSSRARNEELDDKQKALAAAKLQAIQKLRKQREEKQKEKLSEAPAKEVTPPKVPTPQPTSSFVADSTPQRGETARVASSDSLVDDGSSRSVKRLRRAKIAADLSGFDAEMSANAAKIDQLSKQLEQLIANDKRMQQDKAKLIEELEELGIDTEGMEHEELRATKDAIEREQVASSEDAASLQSPAVAITQPAVPLRPASASVPQLPSSESSQPPVAPKDFSKPPVPHASTVISPIQSNGIPGLGTPIAQSFTSSVIREVPAEPKSSEITGPAVERPKPSDLMDTATPMDDEEDFYSPKAAEEPTDAVMTSPSDDGEVPMSESEEEYEPDEPQVLVQSEVPQASLHDTTANPIIAPNLSSSSSDEGELYEPPDVDATVSDAQPGEVANNVDIAAPQDDADDADDADDGAMDISSSEDSDSSDSDSDSSTKSLPRDVVVAAEGQEQRPSATADSQSIAQPAGNGLQDTEQSVASSQAEANPWAFVPYESPLRNFKSYRYHPGYATDVAGGYLSMTYSHQIDPHVPLCPTEALGTPCNDQACQNQHFRNMDISGEKLLVQLGTANPGKTPAERQQWNDGLRNVLKDLRTKNSKDPNVIAMEIANYRRAFLNDKTRVINL